MFKKLLEYINIHPDKNQSWLLISLVVSGLLITYAHPTLVKEIISNLPAQWIAFESLAGWVFALVLSELKPKRRNYIFKIGYELGGYDRYSDIYGYKFKCDPNIARMVGSAIYVTMRGVIKPNIDAMRAEVGGSKYKETLEVLEDGKRDNVGDNDFFTDFRKFMPTAPGPYAPGYTTRPDDTYPSEKKDSYKNLDIDHAIHEYVVNNFNLDNPEFSAMTGHFL